MITVGGEMAAAQSLRGSRLSVDRMYSLAVSNDFEFLSTPRGVFMAVKERELVRISDTRDLLVERVKYPFVLPKTRDVVAAFAARYHAACGERVVVTSAARPLDEQPRNASPWSVHPTGMAVDFRRPAGKCLTFMRKDLLGLEKQGAIEATEERRPAHFHVVVLQRNEGTLRPGSKRLAP